MAKFSAEKYKNELASAASIEELGKKLLPKLKKDQNYIFISYSHRDYKKVYQDLADLRESGVPFWFDEGLPAGENWVKSVRGRLEDPRCRGVIFYLSENLFLSQSLQTEINMVCGRDTAADSILRRQTYFCVNLTRRLPSAILQKTFAKKKFTDTHNKMESLQQWMNTLTQAFSDQDTYLPFSSRTHKDELVKEVGSSFNIYANYNPYDFGDARFVCGSGTIAFENGSRYEGEYCNGCFEGRGKMTYSSGAVYEGEWKAGKHHGEGVSTFADGATYSGGWKNGVRHGSGTMRYASGLEYTGQWQDGYWHGEGAVHYPNGAEYTGHFENGKRSGEGTMHLPDGTVLSGTFRDNEFIGE